MTRNSGISIKDMEQLCAYMDNMLSGKEKSEFEEKLARDAILQQALRDQTILRNTVRSLPVRPAPHNFILTTAEARKIHRNGFLLPFFSWGAALATLVLVVLFVGEFVFRNYSVPNASQTMSLAAQNSTVLATPLSELSDTNNPIILNWNGGFSGEAFGMGGGSGLGDGIPQGLSSEGIQAAPPSTSTAGTPEITPQETETPGLMRTESTLSESAPIIFGIRSDQLGQVLESYPTQQELEAAQNPQNTVAKTTPLINNQIKLTLAGVALIFGLLAYLTYRRR